MFFDGNRVQTIAFWIVSRHICQSIEIVLYLYVPMQLAPTMFILKCLMFLGLFQQSNPIH